MLSNEYISLLQKKINGTISADESLLLSNWLHEAPENEQFAQELVMIWDKSEHYNPELAIDLDEDYAKVIQKIGQTTHKTQRITMQTWWLRVAAAVLLLCGATWTWQRFASNSDKMLLAEANAAKTYLKLPDGSEVWLRDGAKLHYPEHFSETKRQVTLDGEAYFVVAHNAHAPFQVMMAQGGKVEVLGTQFDVKCNGKGHDATVLVKSGKVRFEPTASKSEAVVLTARQKAVYDASNKLIRVSNETTLNELSWQTGGLEFIDAPMAKSLQEIATYYKVEIAVLTPEINDCKLTSPLTTGNSARKVLDNIAMAYNFTLKQISDTKFEISGKACR